MNLQDLKNISIEDLTVQNLYETIFLVRSIFHYEKPFRAPFLFTLSVLPKWMKKIVFPFLKVEQLEFMVLVDNKDKKIIGTTGLFRMKDDPIDIQWLGWFCVSKHEEGCGFGKKMLNFTIEKAKEKNARVLKLFTSDLDYERRAQYLYEKLGFEVVGKGLDEDNMMLLYREKLLR